MEGDDSSSYILIAQWNQGPQSKPHLLQGETAVKSPKMTGLSVSKRKGDVKKMADTLGTNVKTARSAAATDSRRKLVLGRNFEMRL